MNRRNPKDESRYRNPIDDLSNWIRKTREARQLSIQELGSKAGVSPKTIVMLEKKALTRKFCGQPPVTRSGLHTSISGETLKSTRSAIKSAYDHGSDFAEWMKRLLAN